MSHADAILVGVDGSASSLHALDWATAQAARSGQPVTVVCTYSLPSFAAASLDGGYAALDDSAIQEGARAVLDDAKERASRAGVEVTTLIATGDAAGVLVQMSKDFSLAVVGTRGRGGFAERLLGTVSSALPAHAHCPTVVVPFRGDDGGDGAVEIHPLRRIVVGVDGSPSAYGALHLAIKQAQLWDAELVAVAGVPVGSGAGLLAWLPAAIDHEQVLSDVTDGLNAIVDKAEAANAGVKIRRIVLDGTGAELLTEFSNASDLLVVGSRGRGGFAGLLLGSTSQAVLHHSKCPVLVVNKRCETPTE
ncbi:Nucleotide-binding universal stress protein, UspA family [Sanguibacter gelidistatuariae]|uniref:Nucleotide-binding universal stress protein, UspA family n=1 Tax=Sanguibacter gelidistatuariae TaxID=1814289 RepID=A0A1G6Q466_9MICO|nr:universal stress protein [Sanguibacter gelidistatuariae]SDC86427.1 Nucleotide-binding universal stress protein, UspA family [Sanguibacter gelidistatuariae]